MNEIKNFRLDDVPQHAIAFAATSEPDYSMQRILVAEDWPEWGKTTIIDGSHCSCYDFDQTDWRATTYTDEEAGTVIRGWLKSGYGAEKTIATAWMLSGR